MSIKFHIGHPKAYSTYIQSQLVQNEKAGSLIYSGFRPDNDIKNWYQNKVEAECFNKALRFSHSLSFNQKKSDYINFIQNKVESAQEKGLPLWISSENISLPWLMSDIESKEKLRRIEQLLPQKKQYIVIFRNIFSSLMSFYSEYVKQGYAHNFKYFLDEVYYFRESNFVMHLFPGVMTEYFLDVKQEQGLSSDFELTIVPEFDLNNMQKWADEQGLTFFESKVINKGKSLSDAESIANKGGSPTSLSGLIESHRYFWSEKQNVPEVLVWQKLRNIKQNEALAIGNSTNIDEYKKIYMSSTLFIFISAAQKQDEQTYINYQGAEAKFKHSLLWNMEN